MDAEQFFASAALAMGPPPANRAGVAFGSLVGSKVAPVSQPRAIQVTDFREKLYDLWNEMGRPYIPGVWLDINSNLGRKGSEIVFEEYRKWHTRQRK